MGLRASRSSSDGSSHRAQSHLLGVRGVSNLLDVIAPACDGINAGDETLLGGALRGHCL